MGSSATGSTSAGAAGSGSIVVLYTAKMASGTTTAIAMAAYAVEETMQAVGT